MKQQWANALLIITTLLASALGANAETHPAVIVNIPYEFVAAGRTLPAGTYTVSRLSNDRLSALSIANYEQRASVVVLPNQFEEREAEGAKIRLEQVGDMYFLRVIETEDGVYDLPLPRSAALMAKSGHTDGTSASGSH